MKALAGGCHPPSLPALSAIMKCTQMRGLRRVIEERSRGRLRKARDTGRESDNERYEERGRVKEGEREKEKL